MVQVIHTTRVYRTRASWCDNTTGNTQIAWQLPALNPRISCETCSHAIWPEGCEQWDWLLKKQYRKRLSRLSLCNRLSLSGGHNEWKTVNGSSRHDWAWMNTCHVSKSYLRRQMLQKGGAHTKGSTMNWSSHRGYELSTKNTSCPPSSDDHWWQSSIYMPDLPEAISASCWTQESKTWLIIGIISHLQSVLNCSFTCMQWWWWCSALTLRQQIGTSDFSQLQDNWESLVLWRPRNLLIKESLPRSRVQLSNCTPPQVLQTGCYLKSAMIKYTYRLAMREPQAKAD